jgi:lipopolysaccharide export LptBFGC system permease protein LptF
MRSGRRNHAADRVAPGAAPGENRGRLILDRALLREIALRLMIVSAGVIFLIGLGGAIKASSVSQGAPLWVPLTLAPLIVGQALPYFLPLALLTAVVLCYGRMAADGEDVAALAAGAHPWRLLMPALLAGLAAAALTHPLTSEALPDYYRRMRELTARLLVAALENTDPSASELHYGGLHLMWRGRDDEGAFLDVLLHLRADSGSGQKAGKSREETLVADGSAPPPLEELRVRADRARMRVADGALVFSFEGLRAFSETGGAEGWNVQNDGLTLIHIDLAKLAEAQEAERRPRALPSSELRRLVADPAEPEDLRAHARYVLHQRRALSVALLPLAAVGALLGWRMRRGGALAGFGASTALLVLVFYPAYSLGEGLFEAGRLHAVVAAWLPCVAVLVPLAALLWGAGRRR